VLGAQLFLLHYASGSLWKETLSFLLKLLKQLTTSAYNISPLLPLLLHCNSLIIIQHLLVICILIIFAVLQDGTGFKWLLVVKLTTDVVTLTFAP